MRIMIWIFVGLVAVVTTSPSWAACRIRDLAGSFQFYAVGSYEGHAGTTSCTITFDAYGNTVSGQCAGSSRTWTVVASSFDVTSDCMVTGEVIIDDGGGFPETVFIDDAQFDLSKNIIIGNSHDSGGDGMFWALRLK